jgi:hypothetical protein
VFQIFSRTSGIAEFLINEAIAAPGNTKDSCMATLITQIERSVHVMVSTKRSYSRHERGLLATALWRGIAFCFVN